jgi:hypothetical protein
MRSRLTRPLAIGVCVAATLATNAGSLSAGDIDLADLLLRTGTYVQQLERDFALVVSDESYTQHDRVESRPPRSRTLQSEVFFMWIGERSFWISVRNVLRLDGEPVPSSRERLERALNGTATGELKRSQFERLRLEGSRFNLGFVGRTFNDPMFALQVLDPSIQSRFTFRLAGRETIGGVNAWKMTWTEHSAGGTLIVDGEGFDLFSTGAAWVRPDDGVVLKTRLEIENPRKRTKGEIAVAYQHEPRLNLWLPARMDERYQQRADPKALPARLRENIECVALYSNFRRFETAGRVVAPVRD